MWRSLVLGSALLAACGGSGEGSAEDSQSFGWIPRPPALNLALHNVWFGAGETDGTLQFDTDVADVVSVDVWPDGGATTHFYESGFASTHHAIPISGLQPCTTYHFLVWDGPRYGGGSLTTRDAQIVDGSIYVYGEGNAAIVYFQTDMATSSAGAEVDDSPTGNYVSSATSIGAPNTYHAVQVNGLSPWTTYRVLAYHNKSCGYTQSSFNTGGTID
jgi:hypothetical protein